MKTRMVLGWLSGMTNLARAARHPVMAVVESSKSYGLVRTFKILKIKSVDGVDEKAEPEVRFRQAIKHFGYDEKDVERRQEETNAAFWTYAAVGLVVVALALSALRWSESPSPLLTAVAWCAVIIFIGAQAIKNALTNWQIRTRRLGSLRDFLNSGDLIPVGALSPKSPKRK